MVMALSEAIREKCMRDGWYGMDDYNPRRYAFAAADPDFQQPLAPDDMRHPARPERRGFVYPPASEALLRATEARLGFPLPPTLRTLYAEVANGGFGPQAGLRGALQGYPGHYPRTDGTIVGLYPGPFPQQNTPHFLDRRELADEVLLGPRDWPRQFLQICDLGCCIECCLDPDEQLFTLAPAQESDSFWLRRSRVTLTEWLWSWLRGEDGVLG